MTPIPPPGGFPPLSEAALQERLMDILRSGPEKWRKVPITKSNSDARTLFDLIGDRKYGQDFDLKEEECLPRGNSVLSEDLFCLEKPDIVLWSKHSGQHRIVFELKQRAKPTHKEPNASQFLRYFLHLLVTSDLKPKRKQDVRRGVLMVAPAQWFEHKSSADAWNYLVEHYGPLSEQFDITLGEIRAEHLSEDRLR